jgi:hypothetical protein
VDAYDPSLKESDANGDEAIGHAGFANPSTGK